MCHTEEQTGKWDEGQKHRWTLVKVLQRMNRIFKKEMSSSGALNTNPTEDRISESC
jgi:hypothetical protein